MMHEAIASTSLASAAVRNSSFCEPGEAAALWACSAAARTDGQLAVAQLAPAAAKVRERNCLRSSSVINVRSKNDLLRLYSLPSRTSMQKNRWKKTPRKSLNQIGRMFVCDSSGAALRWFARVLAKNTRVPAERWQL